MRKNYFSEKLRNSYFSRLSVSLSLFLFIVMTEKEELRKKMLALRAKLSLSEMKELSEKICKTLEQLVAKENPQVVHVFIPFKNEPDILPFLDFLLEKEKQVIAPKTLRNRQLEHYHYSGFNDLEQGLFKTLYPANGLKYEGKIDMILVPGLAFDRYGYRLGYGGGYYDTFLDTYPNAVKVGIVYPFQLVKKVPVETHDAKMNLIVTGSETVNL
ncbi:5-formyltetrahydrofolate cyclo-ligase [Chondrinema litorale]|uniref:5-formyltetrahydrofolate cyclo-ligase n=1 Tax=Chondrinema litorale TaxID=2994555 RepID=UPI002542C0FF|nr:5-formyltetrahydrofolate cyclo-ligase [Chondrinema litorale]UZR94303.1 5-formyltetrahydrofolate cyclo-ligase [Chondrinema litorale]